MTASRQRREAPAAGFVNFEMSPSRTKIAMAVLAVLAVAAGLLYVLPMRSVLGVIGFPLDDSWIPITFARNLHEFGSYSYFQRDMVASGSTSPAYVLLLSVFFLFTSDPFIPAFAIGILAFAVTVVYTFRAGLMLFPGERWFAAAAALALVFIPKLQSASVSGMSTMLFTALITASMYYYFARNVVVFFMLGAVALWVRPDALIFLLAVLAHLGFHHAVVRDREPSSEPRALVSKRAAMTGSLVAVVIIVAYAVFNLALSGTVFPTSVGAKLAYYHDLTGPPYSGAVLGYFLSPVVAVLFPFAIVAVVVVLSGVTRRRQQPFLMPALYVFGTVLAYGFLLPFLYDDARYLAPTLPFVALLGVGGVRIVFAWLMDLFPIRPVRLVLNALVLAVFAVAIVLGAGAWSAGRKSHYAAVTYVKERQVAAAEWINAHTPKSAVVATHTIGALGYYANRRLIDITGIVTPALLPSIGNLKDLEVYLKAQKATHIATLRERFEVVNANPVFTSDPKTPEVMEVIPYQPGQTHILVQRASALNAQAVAFMQRNMHEQAAEYLRQSYAADPMSARTSTLAGLALLNLKDTTQAVSFLDQSLLLQPDYAPAMVPLADIYYNKKDYKMAVTLLRKALEYAPNMQSAHRSYAQAYKMFYLDSVKAAGWHMLAPISQ